MSTPSVYWAGALFNHKELIGNALLAQAFDRRAKGSWRAVLPQNHECNTNRTRSIRDTDLSQLLQADAIVANFDGTELDSGTVVEFCFAKFLDLPAVLLRTDFRDGNDRSTCPDPWNLMCSDYPRTRSLVRPAMPEFPALVNAGSDLQDAIRTYCDNLADDILEALGDMARKPSLDGDDQEKLMRRYRLVLQSAGPSLAQAFDDDALKAIISRKSQHGIYRS